MNKTLNLPLLFTKGSKEKSSFLKAISFFVTELATHELTAAESCFPLGERTSHFSPREVDQYNFSKCTIIVRLLEFTTMILEKGDQEFWKVSLNWEKAWFFPLKAFFFFFAHFLIIHSQLLEQDLLVSAVFELTALVVCEPSTVGFNMADVEVMKNLPDVCVPLLKALLTSPYHTRIEGSLRTKISRKRYVDCLWLLYFEFTVREKEWPHALAIITKNGLRIVY